MVRFDCLQKIWMRDKSGGKKSKRWVVNLSMLGFFVGILMNSDGFLMKQQIWYSTCLSERRQSLWTFNSLCTWVQPRMTFTAGCNFQPATALPHLFPMLYKKFNIRNDGGRRRSYRWKFVKSFLLMPKENCFACRKYFFSCFIGFWDIQSDSDPDIYQLVNRLIVLLFDTLDNMIGCHTYCKLNIISLKSTPNLILMTSV